MPHYNVTNLTFDGSTNYKANEITGLFPEASGRNSAIGYGGVEGYKPSEYKYLIYSHGGFNVFSMTEVEARDPNRPTYLTNKQYTTIPPEGTIVSTLWTIREHLYIAAEYPAVIKREAGSMRPIAEETSLTKEHYISSGGGFEATCDNNYSSVVLDFANARINGHTATIPTDFHGQGFSVTSENPIGVDYPAITSIIFDATLDMGEGTLLSSSNPTMPHTIYGEDPIEAQKRLDEESKSITRSAYIIGIKGATSTNDIGDALIAGLKKAQAPWRDSIKEDNPGEAFGASDGAMTLSGGVNSMGMGTGGGMTVVKYGSTYMLKMFTKRIEQIGYNEFHGERDNLVVLNGVIGMSGTIGKLETTTDPDPTDPDPTDPDPTDPDPTDPDPTDPDPTDPDPTDPDPTDPDQTDPDPTDPDPTDPDPTDPDPTDPDPTDPDPTDPNPPAPDPPDPDPITPNENDWRGRARRFEGNPLIIHYGPKANQHLRVYINDMHTKAMGLEGVAVDPIEKALEAIGKLDGALEYALNEITRMGAYQQKLQYTIDNNTIAEENITRSESIIRDADMAKTMVEYVKSNVLTQAAQSMLAQANQNSSNVLSLLQ